MALKLVKADKPTEMKEAEITTHLTPQEEKPKEDQNSFNNLAIMGDKVSEDKPSNFFEELDEDITIVPKEYTSRPEEIHEDEEPTVAEVPADEKPAELEEEDNKENSTENAVAKVEEEKIKPDKGGVMTIDKVKEMRE